MSTIDERVKATRAECQMVTQATRNCKRPAITHYIRADGTCIGHYCTQHANGAGAARLLLPRVWEYDHTESYTYYG